MDAGSIALLGLALFVVCIVLVGVIGLTVVTRHPAKYDPARDATRFVVPAFVFAAIAAVGGAAFVVAGIVWLVESLT